ncbi:MAG: hypothetical protein IT292_06695 [Deltaproteobacteria bacterium]|nr:hypothetical protein [Deltaproteobacteria bacterium]
MSNLIEKFKITFELHAIACDMFVAKLRKKYPGIDEESASQELKKWLTDRPGAPLGDGVGTPVDLKRFKL